MKPKKTDAASFTEHFFEALMPAMIMAETAIIKKIISFIFFLRYYLSDTLNFNSLKRIYDVGFIPSIFLVEATVLFV